MDIFVYFFIIQFVWVAALPPRAQGSQTLFTRFVLCIKHVSFPKPVWWAAQELQMKRAAQMTLRVSFPATSKLF